MRERPAALMISGSGRSGTTILSVLLAQGDAVLNIGQARDIWAGWAEDLICTCGAPLQGCALWGAVRRAAFGDWQAQDFRAAETRMRAFVSDADAVDDWADTAALQQLATTHAAFLEDLRRYLRATLDVSGARLLVDSSKTPEIALAVWLAGETDVFVLNMMRDPRAVACSWAKRKSSGIARKMRAWVSRQRRLTRWGDADGLRHRALRYEAFVQDPQAVLRDILGWVGEELPETLFTGPHAARVSWAHQHLFPPSNETVLAEKRQDVTIRAPQDWRALRNWKLHLTALSQTFPEGWRYMRAAGSDHEV